MDTSKTQSIKSLLLQAWRERWSDVTWGIKIKTVLPRGVSGDVYDLADCILQQALVGPCPNNLFMGYLVHCLSSRVISYGAVLSSIGRYQSFYKPYCILSLLDLLISFQARIGCYGNEEECIALCKACVSVTHWLYSCVYHSIIKLNELKQSPEHIQIMEKSYEALYFFSNSIFIKSLLFVGKFEDQGMYTQMLQKHKELEEKINLLPSATNITKEMIEGGLSLVSSVDNLHMKYVSQELSKETKSFQTLASTINTMVVIDSIISPANDHAAFVNHLLLIKKLENFTLSEMYCEILRACLIGIADNSNTFEDDLRFYAFTFLKLPNLVSNINAIENDDKSAFEESLDMILEYTPLLEQVDKRTGCDFIQYITSEFGRVKMLSEASIQKFVTQRQNYLKSSSSSTTTLVKPSTPKPTPSKTPERSQANVQIVLRAEHTLKSILVSLDSDNSKIQEPLLRLLTQIMPPKNIKLILAAFSATGQLSVFISKLIEYNDYNKYVSNETVKGSQTRALMFDATFLLLFYVTQLYGIDVVVAHAGKKDSFFVQWVTECLSEGGKFKCPDLALARSDPDKTTEVLKKFMTPEVETPTHLVKWDEVCLNAPCAAKHILTAWEHNMITTENVKGMLDHIKSQYCFLPMVISAWLCNHINILHHEERLKPMNMLQQFIAPLTETAASSIESPSTPQLPNAESENYYAERSSVMIGIINVLMFDLHPPPQPNAKTPPIITHGLTVKTPLDTLLRDNFHDTHHQGWFNLNALRYFDSLLCVGGTRWLCDRLVRQVLEYRYKAHINRAVDMAIGLFYLDIEQSALCLLLHTLPFYLYSEVHQVKLAGQNGRALARLAVITIYAALQARQGSVVSAVKGGCKRGQREVDIDDIRDYTERNKSSRMHRSNVEFLEDTPIQLQSLNEEQLKNALANPINQAITDLMRTLNVIAFDPTVSARSYFPIEFLQQVVLCAKDRAHEILQFMPLGLVTTLLRKHPEEISHELILAVSSMLSPRARKATALSLCLLTIAKKKFANENEYCLTFDWKH